MIEKKFPARLDALPEVIEFLEGHLEEAGCGMKTIMQCSVALEEMFVNVAHYAYPEREGSAWIGFSAENGVAVIRLTDSGVPFDPLSKEDPDVTRSTEERGIGGLGIYMVKQTMDSVKYVYEDKKNVFTMTKRVQ